MAKHPLEELLDQDREPGMCPACEAVAFPMRAWIHVPPTRGLVLKLLWLCNCGFRRLDLTLFNVRRGP